jgi:hypothetical protein
MVSAFGRVIGIEDGFEASRVVVIIILCRAPAAEVVV